MLGWTGAKRKTGGAVATYSPLENLIALIWKIEQARFPSFFGMRCAQSQLMLGLAAALASRHRSPVLEFLWLKYRQPLFFNM